MLINFNGNKKIILGVGILVAFALLVSSFTSYLNYESSQRFAQKLGPKFSENCTQNNIQNESFEYIHKFIGERKKAEPFAGFFMIPFAAFVGLIVGVIVYHILSEKIQSQETTLEKNTKIILNFLKDGEKKVIETLLENNGSIEQYALTRLPGLDKVKTHRILNSLENKGIIIKERYGKINKIVLNKELYDVLKD